MTRADSFVRSIQDDLAHLQKRLNDVNAGMVRKIDCKMTEVSSVIIQLEDIRKRIPNLIINSED